MHAEVVDNKGGKCPLCGMTLVPVRLALVWSCSVHSNVSAETSGDCRICGRPLVRVTKAVSWTCPVHPKVDVLEPGRCPICRRTLAMKYSRRPHGDHNPKHGGMFFMAPNNWHVEATHPASSIVRLYIYNEYSDPFTPPGFGARVIMSPPKAAGSPPATDIVSPFKRTSGRPYLEARIQHLDLPAHIVVKMRFQPNDPEYHFNFDFFEYSKEPAPRQAAKR
jgi:Heavy metal binding domain